MERSMKRLVSRLRLRPGDCVLVRDHQLAERLSQSRAVNFPVPILCLPPNQSIHRLSRKYLEKLLARTESPKAGAARSAEES